jgi:hypothetical protein
MFFSPIVKGELSTDKIAHIGVSYAIQDVNYAIWSAIAPEHKEDALVMSVLTSALVGITKEMMDASKPGGKFDKKDLAADMLGIGLSVGTTLVFRW